LVSHPTGHTASPFQTFCQVTEPTGGGSELGFVRMPNISSWLKHGDTAIKDWNQFVQTMAAADGPDSRNRCSPLTIERQVPS
jgi:hypothetical protein